MDFINSHLSQKQQIHKIIESQYFTSHKEYPEKDIFRIGKKGVKIIANKELDNKGNFKNYSLLKLSIKPHYYHNNDLHNGNYFTAYESIEVLNDIAQKLNISNMNLLKITSFDFGINMIPDEQDTKDIVNQILFYKKKPFLKVYSHLPYYKTTNEIDSYHVLGVKAYHKGVQFPDYCHPNTFRYENIFKTNRKLKSEFSISNYKDLLNKDTLKNVSDYLLDSWKYILILDEISKEKEINNPNYYEDKRHFRNGISKAKNEYYKTYGNYHKEIKKLLEYTIREKYLKMQNQALIDSWIMHQTAPIEDKTNIEKEYIKKKKNCIVTGLNITMQKERSKYLCVSGLNWYLEHKPKIFNNLCYQYLTKNKRNIDIDKQIYYIAHNIRNTLTNQYHNRKKFEQRNYPDNQLRFDF